MGASDMVAQAHRRGSDPVGCDEEHERVEDDVSKKLMNKMTIRVGIMLFASIAIVTGIMGYVARAEVVGHIAEKHTNVVTHEQVKDQLVEVEGRLKEDINTVKNDLQIDIESVNKAVKDLHREMDKNTKGILDAIKEK